MATADLYYQAMHERLGIFQVIFKLQELFRAGSIRVSAGPGAFGLYRFDKHAILRYKRPERLQAYKRVLGYGPANPGRNARPNQEFHGLFTHFVGETAKFWAGQADQRGDQGTRVGPVVRLNCDRPPCGAGPAQQREEFLLRLR